MKTYGLLLDREVLYGTEYIKASLISREGDNLFPHGISEGALAYDRPKHLADLALDGLGLRGFISTTDGSFIGYDAEYRDVHSVDLPLARRMARTLDKITKRRAKDKAYEAGDTLLSLAKTLKLDFVVERIPNRSAHGSSWSDSDWNWMTVEEGRNRFRALIEQARAERKIAS